MPKISVPSCQRDLSARRAEGDGDTYEGICSLDKDGPKPEELAFSSSDIMELNKGAGMMLYGRVRQRCMRKASESWQNHLPRSGSRDDRGWVHRRGR